MFVVVCVKGCVRPHDAPGGVGGGDGTAEWEDDARIMLPCKMVSPLRASSTIPGAHSSSRLSEITAPWKPRSPSSQFTSIPPTKRPPARWYSTFSALKKDVFPKLARAYESCSHELRTLT